MIPRSETFSSLLDENILLQHYYWLQHIIISLQMIPRSETFSSLPDEMIPRLRHFPLH